MRSFLTSSDLVQWCHRADVATAQRRSHLDAINLIFDDDFDTGTNLNRLWSSVVDLTACTVAGDPKSASPGALLGSWGATGFATFGRSGRLVQGAFRAMATAAGAQPRLDPPAVAELFAAAAEQDWSSALLVEGPQPGTILDVIVAAADAARSARHLGLDAQLLAIAEQARRAVDGTQSQHVELRRAGVVDAGALGLSIALNELPAAVASGSS